MSEDVKPRHIIQVATIIGAAVVLLGIVGIVTTIVN